MQPPGNDDDGVDKGSAQPALMRGVVRHASTYTDQSFI